MKTCVKCSYEWDDEMLFCKNCGTPLNNYCSNPNCSCNDSEAPVEFNSNDCFCSECGCETSFHKEGFIKPKLD